MLKQCKATLREDRGGSWSDNSSVLNRMWWENSQCTSARLSQKTWNNFKGRRNAAQWDSLGWSEWDWLGTHRWRCRDWYSDSRLCLHLWYCAATLRLFWIDCSRCGQTDKGGCRGEKTINIMSFGDKHTFVLSFLQKKFMNLSRIIFSPWGAKMTTWILILNTVCQQNTFKLNTQNEFKGRVSNFSKTF